MKKTSIKFVTANGLIAHKNVRCIVPPTTHTDVHGSKIHYYGIYETSDYTLIGFMTENRAITHSADMGASVAKWGNCRDVVVIFVKGELFFGDGQNLATALMNAGLPIRFKLVNCESRSEALQLIIKLNDTAVNWKLENYINSYAVNNTAFKKVLTYIEKYQALTTATILAIVAGSTVNIAKKIARSGDLVISNTHDVERKLDAISNLFVKVGIKGARATEGIIDYMDFIGIQKYYAEELHFLANIMKAKANQPDLKGWDNQKDAYMFFRKHRPVKD